MVASMKETVNKPGAYLDLLDGVPGGLMSAVLEVLHVGRVLDEAGNKALSITLRHPATNKRVTEFSRNLEFESWYQSLPDELFDVDGVFRPGEDGLWVMLERGYSGNVKLSVRMLYRFEDLDRAVDAWLYGQPARSEESIERLKEHISKDSMVRAHYNAPYAFYDLDLSALDKYLGIEI